MPLFRNGDARRGLRGNRWLPPAEGAGALSLSLTLNLLFDNEISDWRAGGLRAPRSRIEEKIPISGWSKNLRIFGSFLAISPLGSNTRTGFPDPREKGKERRFERNAGRLDGREGERN